MKKFSIIIPTWNRKNYLSQLLISLIKCDYDHSNIEVIICDSYSDDGTNSLINYIKKKYIININHINDFVNKPASKRNNGLLLSKYEWVIFLDDDSIVSNNFLKIISEDLSKNNNNKNVFCARILYPKDKVEKSNYHRYRNSRHLRYDNSGIAELMK